jgi:hypothetical protein
MKMSIGDKIFAVVVIALLLGAIWLSGDPSIKHYHFVPFW